MKPRAVVTWLALLALVFSLFAPGAMADPGKTEYLQPRALNLNNSLKPVNGGALRVPTITWPGDVSTVYTESSGVFKQEGLNVQLFCENDFSKQVQGVLNGETPFLRGTMGMINSAAETFKNSGTDLVVLYQLTWSNGGDCMVVRPGIKNLTDLKGKTIALQLYGPHMDYLNTILALAGLKPTDVHLRWMKELTLPSESTHGKIVDPRSAFAADPSIDACMVISPDAAALTSGGPGKVGTGAEGSVKGAKVLFTSKSANRIIADVYAVRKDYYDAHKDQMEKFVHALMIGQEHFDSLLANKSAHQTDYSQLLSKSATLLFGSSNATSDVEGSLGDCEWVGFNGNVDFFTGHNTTRSFMVLTQEIQSGFIELGSMKNRVALKQAGWDYHKMSSGLSNVNLAAVPKPAFNSAKVQQKVEKASTELSHWDEGTLYQFEIHFAPNQKSFDVSEYKDAFKKALDLSQTMGGTVVIIEGHNAPDAINKARAEGKSQAEISMLEQASKNLSYGRAIAVRNAYLQYCKDNGLQVDASQFVPVGMGAKSPKFAVPQTESEWNANRRVVFRIKTMETELDSFKPSK